MRRRLRDLIPVSSTDSESSTILRNAFNLERTSSSTVGITPRSPGLGTVDPARGGFIARSGATYGVRDGDSPPGISIDPMFPGIGTVEPLFGDGGL